MYDDSGGDTLATRTQAHGQLAGVGVLPSRNVVHSGLSGLGDQPGGVLASRWTEWRSPVADGQYDTLGCRGVGA